MSQCLVPNCNLKQQRQQQVEEGEEGISRRSSHVHSDWHNHLDPAATHLVPMSNYDEVAELTWENGQPSMHGLGGLLPTSQEKPTWVRAHDTLESIVQQATCQPQKSKFTTENHDLAPSSTSSIAASSREHQMLPTMTKKRSRSNCDQHGRDFSSNTKVFEEYCDLPTPRGCASASATFCRDSDTTMMTWASLESGRSLKDKILEEDSACHSGSEIRDNQDDKDTKEEIGRSNSIRRNRTATIHNQSERRRRDRINQKMKALQRLVPNASKSDKASMLEEVINYLKQLQAQIQMMSMTSMPQMMMPLAMQQQLQMSMLARSMGARLGMGMGRGMGMGMGMVNINNMAAPRSFPQLIQPTTIGAPATAPVFGAPSFMMPSLIQAPPKHEPAASSNTNASIPLPAPYCSSTFTQPVNMDLINSMAALYMQQMSQNNQALSSLSQPNREQGN